MEDAGLHVIVDARVRDVAVFTRDGLERYKPALLG